MAMSTSRYRQVSPPSGSSPFGCVPVRYKRYATAGQEFIPLTLPLSFSTAAVHMHEVAHPGFQYPDVVLFPIDTLLHCLSILRSHCFFDGSIVNMLHRYPASPLLTHSAYDLYLGKEAVRLTRRSPPASMPPL